MYYIKKAVSSKIAVLFKILKWKTSHGLIVLLCLGEGILQTKIIILVNSIKRTKISGNFMEFSNVENRIILKKLWCIFKKL